MPKLDTTLHVDMYERAKHANTFSARVKRALNAIAGRDYVYGLEWGNPETDPPLRYIRDTFLLPYLTKETVAVEIGPGGGRWTRYMLGVKKLYAVDFHQELLDGLKRNFRKANLTFIRNAGDDFPGIPDESIDFIFSFGTFVHLDVEIIDRYLNNMRRLLRSNSNVVIQYSDKTKPLGKRNKGFSDNDPDRMRDLVLSHGYSICEEDTKTLWHSSMIRFQVGNR